MQPGPPRTEYLNQFPLDEIPAGDRGLANAALAMCEVDNAVNKWQSPTLINGVDVLGLIEKNHFTKSRSVEVTVINPPQFRPLFSIKFVTQPQIFGDVPMGYFRRAGIISAGSFEGERLKGRALPGGGDWLIRRPDGVIHVDVRAILETDAGESIYMTYTGRLRQSGDVDARLAAGETVADVYFRTAVQFETAAPRLAWLNDVIAFGIGQRHLSGPTYFVYELL